MTPLPIDSESPKRKNGIKTDRAVTNVKTSRIRDGHRADILHQRLAREPSELVSLVASFKTPDAADEGEQTLTQNEFEALAPYPTNEGLTFSNQGLVGVKDISFTLREIEQINPYPCAENVITVTLVPDTELKERCEPEITLTGLTGSLG